MKPNPNQGALMPRTFKESFMYIKTVNKNDIQEINISLDSYLENNGYTEKNGWFNVITSFDCGEIAFCANQKSYISFVYSDNKLDLKVLDKFESALLQTLEKNKG